jgi:molybdopterin/thiamine biosynthesis adenylyltransferase
MDRDSLLNKLKALGIHSKDEYMAEAFSRNIGLLTAEDQKKLAHAVIAIPGMGGVGGSHLITMVRTGAVRFHLADFDVFEPVNVNRQFGARVPAFGRSKLEVMKEEALRINPFLEIKEFPEGLTPSNMDDFLNGVQVVLDGLDFFNFDTRRLLFNQAREKGVYVITAGPLGYSAAMLIFSPHEGMSFDEYFNIVEGMAPQEQYLAFALGLAPRSTHIRYMDLSRVDFTSKEGPSLNIACQICSGMAAAEAVRIILEKSRIKPVPHFFQFDPYLQKYRRGYLFGGNRNLLQRLRMKAAKLLLKRNKARFKPQAPEFPTAKVSPGHLPDEIARYLILAGIQAPSGDNAQPWKFSCLGNTVLLYLDRDADHSFFNVKQIASIISCGAVLENMRIAASAFGLEAKIDYLPDGGKDDLMASVELVQKDIKKDPLFGSIWSRHTNRRFFDRKPILSEIADELQESISVFSGAGLHIITEETDLKKLAQIVYQVDRIRTEHRPLHEHLCRMIRYTPKEAAEKRDGLPLKNLEAGLAGEYFLKLSRPWQVMRTMNRIGLGRLVALHSYQGIINASGAALLTVDGMEPEDFLKGGQALEHIWLSMTRKGIFVQPMTAITLFRLRWQMEGPGVFSQKHRRLLQTVWKRTPALFPEVDFARHGMVMLFRFGYGKEIRCGTYRKDIDSFLGQPLRN